MLERSVWFFFYRYNEVYNNNIMKPIFVDIWFSAHIYSQKYRFANKYGYAYFSPILLYDNNLYKKLQLETADINYIGQLPTKSIIRLAVLFL